MKRLAGVDSLIPLGIDQCSIVSVVFAIPQRGPLHQAHKDVSVTISGHSNALLWRVNKNKNDSRWEACR
jgi:hypothetical protein